MHCPRAPTLKTVQRRAGTQNGNVKLFPRASRGRSGWPVLVPCGALSLLVASLIVPELLQWWLVSSKFVSGIPWDFAGSQGLVLVCSLSNVTQSCPAGVHEWL